MTFHDLPFVRALSALFVLAVTLGGQAAGQEHEASGLLERAERQFADGAINEAAATLRAATAKTEDPALLAQIHLQLGLVHATRAQLAEARAAFRRALSLAPGITLDAHRFRPDFVELFREVRRETVGEVQVAAGRSGKTEVWIDGQRRCDAPCRHTLVVGRHWLELRDPSGRRLDGRSIVVKPGLQTSVVLGAVSSRPAVGPAARVEGRTALAPVDRPSRKPSRRRVWTWVAGAGALAAGAAALGLGLAARQDRDEACDLLAGSEPCGQRTSLVDRSTLDRYRALGDAMDRKALAANICGAVAAGLAVTSVVLYFFEGRTSEATIGVHGDAAGAALFLRLRR
jgi:tetratricopeptide (TPR) repeat protein